MWMQRWSFEVEEKCGDGRDGEEVAVGVEDEEWRVLNVEGGRNGKDRMLSKSIN